MIKISQKAARVNAELTQQQVANMMGVQKATILNWEKGRFPMKKYQKEQMAKIYGMDIKYIFFADEVRKNRT